MTCPAANGPNARINLSVTLTNLNESNIHGQQACPELKQANFNLEVAISPRIFAKSSALARLLAEWESSCLGIAKSNDARNGKGPS